MAQDPTAIGYYSWQYFGPGSIGESHLMMVDALLEDQANDGECFVSMQNGVLCDPAEVMLRWAPTNQWMQAESSELCQTKVQSYVMLHNDIDCFIVPQA